MPLTAKGKKLKAKFRDQYGKKKGDSVFYAMENSGKLKKVIKARGGGMDASSDDFGTGPSGKGDGRDLDFQQRGMSKKDYDKSKQGQNFGGRNNVTTRKGPNYIDTRPLGIFTPVSYQLATTAINLGKKQAYNTKNLKEQRNIDPLGGEMLTTGPTGPKNNTRDGGGPSITPTQPIQPIATTKKIDQTLINPKDNFFNFKAYKVGGLSGGVSYGPPPKRGPNSQVPPIKMKRGGYKK